MAIIKRNRALSFFFIPFVVSECYIGIAVLFHGRLSETSTAVPEYLFALIQIALITYLVYRLRSGGVALWALAIFSLSYAAFGYFMAGMVWTDSYL